MKPAYIATLNGLIFATETATQLIQVLTDYIPGGPTPPAQTNPNSETTSQPQSQPPTQHMPPHVVSTSSTPPANTGEQINILFPSLSSGAHSRGTTDNNKQSVFK
jgi:heme/copper-type cytochrome/quinol oxidase subunit 1